MLNVLLNEHIYVSPHTFFRLHFLRIIWVQARVCFRSFDWCKHAKPACLALRVPPATAGDISNVLNVLSALK